MVVVLVGVSQQRTAACSVKSSAKVPADLLHLLLFAKVTGC